MSDHKALVEHFLEIVNSHDFQRFKEVVADDYVQHNPHAAGGLNGLITYFESQLQELPELRGELQLIVTEGDMVAARTTVTGLKNGRRVENAISDFWRVRGGKLAEHW